MNTPEFLFFAILSLLFATAGNLWIAHDQPRQSTPVRWVIWIIRYTKGATVPLLYFAIATSQVRYPVEGLVLWLALASVIVIVFEGLAVVLYKGQRRAKTFNYTMTLVMNVVLIPALITTNIIALM